MNIMVLDDEIILRNSLKKYLSSLNHPFDHILSAANAREAFTLADAYTPDIILADIIMPGLDGISFCKKVREKKQAVQIIIVTGHSDMSYIKSAIKLSVVDYLFKPVDFQELNDAIDKAVHRAKGSRDAKRPPSPHDGASKYTRLARDYVHDHYYRAMSVQSVADLLKVSPNYFSATFKHDMGMGFSDYLTAVRLDKAIALLDDPLLSIHEISRIIGYEDHNYFSRVFKKNYALTPSEYRQRGAEKAKED